MCPCASPDHVTRCGGQLTAPGNGKWSVTHTTYSYLIPGIPAQQAKTRRAGCIGMGGHTTMYFQVNLQLSKIVPQCQQRACWRQTLRDLLYWLPPDGGCSIAGDSGMSIRLEMGVFHEGTTVSCGDDPRSRACREVGCSPAPFVLHAQANKSRGLFAAGITWKNEEFQ